MRTLFDSFIDIYKIFGSEEIKKEKVIENGLAKIETKNYSIINEGGKRTFQTETYIYFDRKTIKEWDLSEIDDNAFLVNRIAIRKNRESVNEWFQVEAPKSRDGSSETIVLKCNRINNFTDTNNFKGFEVIK